MAIYTMRTGATAHPEDTVMQFMTDLIRVAGVLDLSSTANLKVVQRGAGANMSVDISIGRGFIKGSSTNAYPVRNTTALNAVIGANASGNPRKDAVVLYIDLAESPTTTADDVVKTAVVAGTPAASPTSPSDGTIQSAVGASNPFLRLADVTVANGAASILTANILDTRVQFRTRHQLYATTTTYGATVAIDVGTYNDQIITLTGNLQITSISNYQTDVPIILRFVQGGSGGYTVDWSLLAIDWFDGTPVVTPVLNKKDSFLLIPRSNSRFEGFVMGQNANIS